MIFPVPLALKRLAAALRVFSLGMGRFYSTQSPIVLLEEPERQAFPASDRPYCDCHR